MARNTVYFMYNLHEGMNEVVKNDEGDVSIESSRTRVTKLLVHIKCTKLTHSSGLYKKSTVVEKYVHVN